MKSLFLILVALFLNISICYPLAAKEYQYPDFSIEIPETWKVVELDQKGDSKSWLFGKPATENEGGASIAVYIRELSNRKFNSAEELTMAKDRRLNRNIYTMGKSKKVLNTSVIYDEVIDGENFRAINFRSLFTVHDRPDLELRIFGREYLSIINSKVIAINFQAPEKHEEVTKPELERIVETIRLIKK